MSRKCYIFPTPAPLHFYSISSKKLVKYVSFVKSGKDISDKKAKTNSSGGYSRFSFLQASMREKGYGEGIPLIFGNPVNLL